jgi:hypothetical protein
MGQDETKRSHAGEVVGQQPAQQPGIILLLGGGPALHHVEDTLWSCHHTSLTTDLVRQQT